MKLSLLIPTLAMLSCAACSSPPSEDAAGSEDSNLDKSASGTKLTCTEDKSRESTGDQQAFSSFTMTISAQKVTITSIVFTASMVDDINNEIKNEQDFLTKGVDYDGKTPITADEKNQATTLIANDQKLLAANGKLALAGAMKPYVRKPKQPTVQYPLDVTTANVDADTLWGIVGNEGTGARLLAPPAVSTGTPGTPDIEFEGDQGPGWDRYICK